MFMRSPCPAGRREQEYDQEQEQELILMPSSVRSAACLSPNQHGSSRETEAHPDCGATGENEVRLQLADKILQHSQLIAKKYQA